MNQLQIHVPETIVHSHGSDIKNIFSCQEKLGQGGFAAVYRVTHQDSNKSYAIKVIPKEGCTSSKTKAILEKLKNEISIQKKLNHPNIVLSKVSFSDETNNYIVLEYCPGKSIREYMKKSENGRLTEAETRKILNDVIDGLSYLHNRHIVHNDLKLENFLIGKDGKVKIADFGLAAIVKEENDNDKKRPICGTTNYLSPEIVQKKGQGFEVDIWAIGVAAFIMLTGRPPFDGGDKEMTYENIKNCSYQFPTKVQLSAEAKDFIRTILRVDPHKRPTAIDLIDHPFLTKFDKEQVQLFKPRVPPIQKVQSPQKFPSVPSNISNTTTNSNNSSSFSPNRYSHQLPMKPSVASSLTPTRIRSFSCLSSLQNSNVQDEGENPQRRSNLSGYNLICDHENNESNAAASSYCCSSYPTKKNFVVPNYIVTKHCFSNNDLGYLLADGTVGVVFDDKTRLVISPTEKFVQFYKNANSYAEVFNTDECSIHESLKAKIGLVKTFAKSFKKFKYLYELEDRVYDPSVTLQNVKYFVKKDDLFLFKFGNKNIQVNFSDFKKLLIIWNTKKMCIFRVIKEKCSLIDLNDAANLNENSDEFEKFKKAKDLMPVYDRKNLGIF